MGSNQLERGYCNMCYTWNRLPELANWHSLYAAWVASIGIKTYS